MADPVFLGRHGETPYNVERRFQGQNDVGLTARGEQQARKLADNAAGHGLRTLYCSPLRRARVTAQAVAEVVGLEPRPDPRFMEHDTGDWTDKLFADVEREQPELYAAYYATDPDFAFPGGESLRDFMARVVDGLTAVAQAGGLPALVVCHRGVVRAARSHTAPRGLLDFMTFDVPNGTMEAL